MVDTEPLLQEQTGSFLIHSGGDGLGRQPYLPETTLSISEVNKQ